MESSGNRVSDSGDDSHSNRGLTGSSPFAKLSMSGIVTSIVSKITRSAVKTVSPPSSPATETRGRKDTSSCQSDAELNREVSTKSSVVGEKDKTELSAGLGRRHKEMGYKKSMERLADVNTQLSSKCIQSDTVTKFYEEQGPTVGRLYVNPSLRRVANTSRVVKPSPKRNSRMLPQFRKETSILSKSLSETVATSADHPVLPSYSSPFTGQMGQMPAVHLSPRRKPPLLKAEDCSKPVTVKISQADPLRSPYTRYQTFEDVNENGPAYHTDLVSKKTVAEALRKRRRSSVEQEENDDDTISENVYQLQKRKCSRDIVGTSGSEVSSSIISTPHEVDLSRGLKRPALHRETEENEDETDAPVHEANATKKVCQNSSPPASMPQRYGCGAKNLIDASYSSSERFKRRLGETSGLFHTSGNDDMSLTPGSSNRTSPCSSRLSHASLHTSQVLLGEDRSYSRTGLPSSALSSRASSPAITYDKSQESGLNTPQRQLLLLIKDGNSKNRVTTVSTSSSTEDKLSSTPQTEEPQTLVSFTADDLERDRLLLANRASCLLAEAGLLEDKDTTDGSLFPPSTTAITSSASGTAAVSKSMSDAGVSSVASMHGASLGGKTVMSSLQLQGNLSASGVGGDGERAETSFSVGSSGPNVSLTQNVVTSLNMQIPSTSISVPKAADTDRSIASSVLMTFPTVQKSSGASTTVLKDLSTGGSSVLSSNMSGTPLEASNVMFNPSKALDTQSVNGLGTVASNSLKAGSGISFNSPFASATEGSMKEINTTLGQVAGLSTKSSLGLVNTSALTTEGLNHAKAVATSVGTTASVIASNVVTSAAKDNIQMPIGGFAFGKSETKTAGNSGFAFGDGGTTQAIVGGSAVGNLNKTQTTVHFGTMFGSSGTTQTTAGALPFGNSSTTQATAGGFSFGNASATQAAAGGFSSGNSSTTQATAGGFSFGNSSATQATAGGFSLGSGTNNQALSSTQNGFNFGNSDSMKPNLSSNSQTSVFTFGTSQPSTGVSVTSASVPGGGHGSKQTTNPFGLPAYNSSSANPNARKQTPADAFSSNSTTLTTAFGSSATNVFGSNATSASTFGGNANLSSASGSNVTANAFGSNATPTNTFGSNANLTNVPNAFGYSATSSNAFGSSTSTANAFGSSATQTNAFGSHTASNVFGNAVATNTFGSNIAAANAFGSSGVQQVGTTATNTKPFGSCTATASPFGMSTATTNAFGANTAMATPFGNNTAATAQFGNNQTNFPAFGNNATAPTLGNSFQSPTPTIQFGNSNAVIGIQSTPQNLKNALFPQTATNIASGVAPSSFTVTTGHSFLPTSLTSTPIPSGGTVFGKASIPTPSFTPNAGGNAFAFKGPAGKEAPVHVVTPQPTNPGYNFQTAVQAATNAQTPNMGFNFQSSGTSTNFAFSQMPGVGGNGVPAFGTNTVPKFTTGASFGSTGSKSIRAKKKTGK